MTRNAVNRAIETFTDKYPQYRDCVFLNADSRMVTFKTNLYYEVMVFPPFTPKQKVTGWLGVCRKVDLNMQNKRFDREVLEKQQTLL